MSKGSSVEKRVELVLGELGWGAGSHCKSEGGIACENPALNSPAITRPRPQRISTTATLVLILLVFRKAHALAPQVLGTVDCGHFRTVDTAGWAGIRKLGACLKYD